MNVLAEKDIDLTISLVVAAATNDSIGKDGQLLWHLPRDLKFFKNTTWGMPVIMGRKTFESVGKPLPGRTNIVVTSSSDWKAGNVEVAGSIGEAIQKAKETNSREAFIIGGGEIYKQSMQLADKIYMTRVHAELEGDTFFPAIDPAIWVCTSSIDFKADDKHAFDHSFEVWEKKQASPIH